MKSPLESLEVAPKSHQSFEVLGFDSYGSSQNSSGQERSPQENSLQSQSSLCNLNHQSGERIAVFIPAYNCEKQIGRVLAQFEPDVQKMISHIRVINNASRDNTLARALEAAQKIKHTQISVVTNNQNYNLGGTIKLSLDWAIEQKFDYLVCLHGDDQPDIRDLIVPLKNGMHRSYAVLAGARFHPESKVVGYSWVRILGNQFFNLLCSIVFRRRIYDLIAGLNVFRLQELKSRFWMNFPNDLTFDVHLLFYCMKNGLKVGFAPISWREEDQVSNAKTFKQGLRILRLVFFYVTKPSRLFSTNYPGNEGKGCTVEYFHTPKDSVESMSSFSSP